MKITQLLKLLDKKTGGMHEFQILSDGSGSIMSKNDIIWIAEWDNEEQMHITLENVYKSVAEQNINFKL